MSISNVLIRFPVIEDIQVPLDWKLFKIPVARFRLSASLIVKKVLYAQIKHTVGVAVRPVVLTKITPPMIVEVR